MHYAYVLRSEKSGKYYYGSTLNLRVRLFAHNSGQTRSTKADRPWGVVWYGGFRTKAKAEAFERYLKTASGKAFLRKRLL